MSPWIAIVIGAHLLNALAFLADKFLLARVIPRPSVYAFFVGALGAVTFALLPFDAALPATAAQALLDFATGAIFVLALIFFFSALRRGEASRIVPYVGGTIPLWTLVLAYLVLGERLPRNALLAFGVLVVGSALIARESPSGRARQRYAYTFASLAAVSFAVAAVLMKAVFLEQRFIPGFVWSRAGALLAAAAILLHTPSRAAIVRPSDRPQGRHLGLFLSGQVAGAAGFLTLQYAVSIASPTLVNALQGVQYAFLFALAAILGRTFPQLRERRTRAIIVQKVIAIAVITLGLAMLSRAT